MSHTENAITVVNEYLTKIGISPSDFREENDEYVTWNLQQGSASFSVYVEKDDDFPLIKIVSPLVIVPEDKKTLALFEFCMLQNYDIGSATLCYEASDSTSDGIIYLATVRPCEGLDMSEMGYSMRFIGNVADELDNVLVEKYGCTSPNID